MKNKKADITITILVILITSICILTITSFLVSKEKVQSNYLGLELFEGMSADVETFYFYLNAGFTESEAAEKIGAEMEGSKLVIDKIFKENKDDLVSVHYNMSVVRGS